MFWFWKLLGYKDEEKELIKQHQLQLAKEFFNEKDRTIKIPEEKPEEKNITLEVTKLSKKQLRQLRKLD